MDSLPIDNTETLNPSRFKISNSIAVTHFEWKIVLIFFQFFQVRKDFITIERKFYFHYFGSLVCDRDTTKLAVTFHTCQCTSFFAAALFDVL